MASSSSKPTGVHYALVFCILLTIVCGLGWLLAYKGNGSIGELRTERDKLKSQSDADKKALETALAEIKRIKDLLGSNFESVGEDTSAANSVLGDMATHMKTYGRDLAKTTYNETMVALATELRNMTAQRDKLQEQVNLEIAMFEQKKNELNAALAVEKEARNAADKAKVDADNAHKEELARKEEDINTLRQSYTDLDTEFAEYKESMEGPRGKLKILDTRITNLTTINEMLSKELDEKKRTSFEIPDGEIRWIDNLNRRVYINLGEVDGLRVRTGFSVYRKNHSGVGRGTEGGAYGAEDIKGKIEVTRIIDAHTAEARIIEEELTNPMGKGDPIYTPLWSPGRAENFAFVGILDLDGDGKSDRDLLKDILRTAGAGIDNEVDDNGVLWVNGKQPDDGLPKINEHTKFLVVGKIPDIASTADPEEQKIIQNILTLRKDLELAARERGVPIRSLSDFLNYIGYKQQRRLFVPGSDVPYNLKSGSRSTGVSDSPAARQSSGQTSGAYSGNPNLKKVFRRGQ
jgi:hypothetical protein